MLLLGMDGEESTMEYLVKMKCDECGKDETLIEGSTETFRMEVYPKGWWMLRVHTGFRATDTRSGTHWFCSLDCAAKWSGKHTAQSMPNAGSHRQEEATT